ncbi:hypothetical protein FK268_07560 [Tsukamurella sputi]|uniref:DUF2142 domain-containing protein n=1 Tax=Tsukamurella sputi TaxID=2591848 RepID=A0A5C5RRJ4_9ACTN|nr:hypothetical protein [Tsukamurella sputi]TWS25073.1 hypothetical protein FK268_07560 [Tsukamurella sputi]
MKTVRFVARTLALTLLLAGAVAAITSMMPRTADAAAFSAALERGDVVAVELPASSGNASGAQTFDGLWATGPYDWHRGQLGAATTEGDLRALLSAHGVDVRRADDDSLISWPFAVPTWLGFVVTATWLATFVAMVASPPVYGNRWAWFWLFTIGQVGALAYLVLEPVPLHRALAPSTPELIEPARERWTGPQGCLASPFVAIAAAMAASVLGWALNAVLS